MAAVEAERAKFSQRRNDQQQRPTTTTILNNHRNDTQSNNPRPSVCSQVAQQEAERAKFVVDKAKQEKKSTIIKAEGEARSAKLIGDAVRDNPGYIQV